jgi:hypothetical protein
MCGCGARRREGCVAYSGGRGAGRAPGNPASQSGGPAVWVCWVVSHAEVLHGPGSSWECCSSSMEHSKEWFLEDVIPSLCSARCTTSTTESRKAHTAHLVVFTVAPCLSCHPTYRSLEPYSMLCVHVATRSHMKPKHKLRWAHSAMQVLH